MTRTKHLWASLLVLALAIVFQVMSHQLPASNRTVPVLVGWIAIVLCVVDVIAHTGTSPGQWIARVLSGSVRTAQEEEAGPALGTQIGAFLWIIAACAGVFLFGFFLTIPVYVFVYIRIRGGRPPVPAAAIAAAVVLAIWVTFEVLLDYEIYRGLLLSDL